MIVYRCDRCGKDGGWIREFNIRLLNTPPQGQYESPETAQICVECWQAWKQFIGKHDTVDIMLAPIMQVENFLQQAVFNVIKAGDLTRQGIARPGLLLDAVDILHKVQEALAASGL